MHKDVAALKGEAVYKRGVRVGKSFWFDSYIVLARKGAVIESRSIRRLTAQFSADDLVVAKGLFFGVSQERFSNLVVSCLDRGQQQANGSRSSRPRPRSMAWSVTPCSQA